MRRQDLRDSSEDDDVSHDDASAAIRARLDERMSGMFALDDLGTGASGKEVLESGGVGQADGQPDDDAAADGRPAAAEKEEAFEFRLFSTSDSARVVLAPEDDGIVGDGEGGIASTRPVSFYVRGDLSPEERSGFQHAAVGYDDVLRAAGRRAWGLEVPWRVTHVTVKPGRCGDAAVEVRVGEGMAAQQHAAEDPGKRKRPGKKRRILLRTRERARKEKEEAAGKQKMAKEEHLKEKKKRLNRERKLKRRQKEREKKLAGKSETGVDRGGSSVDSDGTE